jgi:hypothetical protein
MATTDTRQTTDEALAAAKDLCTAGEWGRALEHLMAAAHDRPDATLEVALASLRHRAAVHRVESSGDGAGGIGTAERWPPIVPDYFADVVGIPEIDASDLTAALLASALQHHGSLLVRRCVPPSVAEATLEAARRGFAAEVAFASGAPLEETSPWYVPFEPVEGCEFGAPERLFSRTVGGLLVVDSPRTLRHVVDALLGARFDQVVGDYLGERPVLSAKKTTLRHATPDSPTEWHQDGSFLGSGARTVNVWTALTPCGVDAPGIEVFARSFDHIVPTGTDDALFDWSVSREQADRLGRDHVVGPRFEAGDALFFDQLTLHRTGITAGMTRERYAIESWLFAPSFYPGDQVPIAI